MDNNDVYKVQLGAFEGPMDLLLHLIERNKIDIYDIPIALLTEQYMEYLAKFKQFNIDIASEFLVMAATLLQIKSRILLPDAPIEEGQEEEEGIDPRQELVERLLEYKRYKQVSELLQEMGKEAGKRYFREGSSLSKRHVAPANMEIALLMEAFQNVLEGRVEHEPPVVNVSREQFTIEDKIVFLLALLKENDGNIAFNNAFAYGASKGEIIATFLAMLELIKIRRISIYQTGTFSPIYIKILDEQTNQNSQQTGNLDNLIDTTE